MPRVTGGQAIVDCLEAEGVEVVFGIPGEHTIPLYDGLFHTPSIRHILPRHEQGAGFMAEGYAMASGKVGVCITTTGPGAFNALTPLAEAYGDSMPVLLIASEIESEHIGRARGITHESKDQLGVLERASGWAAQAGSVGQIPEVMHEAFARLRSGRPRPAVVQVPLDVIAASGEASPLPPAPVCPAAADPVAVAAAAEALAAARRPIIWAGGGANIAGANEALRELAELLGAPVVATPDGKGAIPEDHRLALGSTSGDGPVAELLRRADAALVVGTRFQQRLTRGWTMPLPPRLVQVDVDPTEIGKNYPASHGLAGDAKVVLGQLLGQLRGREIAPKPELGAELAAVRGAIDGWLRERFTPEVELLGAIRRGLARDALMFSDTARGVAWLRNHLPVYAPRSFFTPGGFSTLGFSFPAALGAKAAFPDRQAVAACGDGSFMFTCNELATAVQEGLGATVLLFNNRCHQGIKDHQDAECGGRHIAVELHQPDFLQLAASFGALGLRVERLEDLEPALVRARDSGKPAIVEVTFDVRRVQRAPEAGVH
jgi:thiamine pyrophosphate-dependent acetolactate synthase large subunit-like protein